MEKEPTENRSLAGLSADERCIMERMLRTPPEPYKATPKLQGTQAQAQRRRREKERKHLTEASSGV